LRLFQLTAENSARPAANQFYPFNFGCGRWPGCASAVNEGKMELNELISRAAKLELKAKHLVGSRFAGLFQSAFRGQGMEFQEVREYAEGDDVRLIDWNVSARTSSLHVKRMTEERERSVLLVFDISGSIAFGSTLRTKFDLLLEIGALFTLAGFYSRDRVSLALVRDRIEMFVPPGKGWSHAARLIREMVAAHPEGGAGGFEPVWSFLNAPGVPRSLVLVLTDFQVPIAASDSFAVACRKHEVVMALASDQREIRLPNSGRTWFQDPESGQRCLVNTNQPGLRQEYEKNAQEKRGELTSLLRHHGVDWVELDTASDYEIPLRNFLTSRSARTGYRRR
jgi:uncharacterized protein (DUF58 family)